MDVFEMVVLVVLFALIAEVLRTWLKSRTPGAGGLSAEQAARLARLEERIKSLESVVSDASYDLKQKFKDLEKT